jgi:hypothetical protein
MDEKTFRTKLEAQYGGPVPDFDERDYHEMYVEFGDLLDHFGAFFIVATQRMQKPTEFEIEFRENFIERHAPKDANGEISDEDWNDTFNLAKEEMYRMGLVRIPHTRNEARKRMYDEQARIDANKE